MKAYSLNQEKDLFDAAMLICGTDYSEMSEAEQKQFIVDVLEPFNQEEALLCHSLVSAIGAIKNYYSQGMN